MEYEGNGFAFFIFVQENDGCRHNLLDLFYDIICDFAFTY